MNQLCFLDKAGIDVVVVMAP